MWRVSLYSASHEKRLKELSQQLRDVTEQRDSTSQELTEVRVQMKIVEDCRDAVKRDLAEAADNIRRGIQLNFKF